MSKSLDKRTLKIMGIAAVVLGVLVMLVPGVVGFSIAIIIGVLVTLGGILRITWAFRAATLGKGLIMLAVGGLTLVAGLAMVIHPVIASGMLTIILAAYFMADGAAEISAGFLSKPLAGWRWLVFAGIISIILGVMIISQFPLAGAWAVGILLGIKLLFVGLVILNTPQAVSNAKLSNAKSSQAN
jgi:uncharacterized membrane protein HdeD (DUF308 family)